MKQTSTRISTSTRFLLTAASSLGVALLITGCTSGSGTTPPPVSSGTTAQATESVSGTPDPSPSVSHELAFIAGPELDKALDGWAKTQPGSIFTADASLRAKIPAAEKWLTDIDVKPTECGLYGIGSLKDQLDASVMSAVTLAEKTGADITVASYQDLNALVADVAAQQHLDKSCAKYTVSGKKQKFSVTLSPLKVATSAPYSAGTQMVTNNEGTESKQASVRAIDGHVMITATRGFTADPAAATKLATADVESILTLLREREAQAGAGR